jgi:hypothetical protein
MPLRADSPPAAAIRDAYITEMSMSQTDATPANQPATAFRTFAEFYPFYLSQHAEPTCRRLHFVGSWVVLGILAYVIASGNLLALVALPLAGYGFAWLGHFGFEKNKPATFTYPFYSFMGDWVMFKDILTGKVRF